MQELLEVKSHYFYICYIHEAKYQRYNGLYELEHHREMVWYCKANFKTNPLRLETKKGKLYTHLFKCINCKGKHQVDSYNYLF